jgi:hypothetical protein
MAILKSTVLALLFLILIHIAVLALADNSDVHMGVGPSDHDGQTQPVIDVRQEKRVSEKSEAGGWTAWVESTLADDPRKQAPAFNHVVYRQGPKDEIPLAIYQRTDNRGLRVWLRDDGMAAIQGCLLSHPVLAHHGSEPNSIILPLPTKWDRAFPPYGSIGRLWFLEDVVLYSRYAYPGHTLIGFFRINPVDGEVTENVLTLEVVERQQEPAHAAAIADDAWKEPLFRAGNSVFWKNEGSRHAAGEWRERKLWALSLRDNHLVEVSYADPKLQRQHMVEIVEYLERIHNQNIVLETWAVSVAALIGTMDDINRLTELSASSAQPSIATLYTRAVETILDRQK